MIRLAAVLLVIAYFLRRKPKSRWGALNSPSWSSDALNEPTYAGGEW